MADARILIVDDTPINLMITSEILEGICENVDTAESGQEAVEMVKNNTYSLVFMDYMMPGMNGVDATKAIRALAAEEPDRADYYTKLPIVALSGDMDDDIKEAFVSAGANGIMGKPVYPDRLKGLAKNFVK